MYSFRNGRDKPLTVHSDTDFSASLGPGGYSWNVIRSESDELIFRHAAESGAKIFDGTKVESITFEPYPHTGYTSDAHLANPGRPVSATWSRKDGSTGNIKFEYLIDASGRNGVISTKYLKNRQFNLGLKNIANWAYWKGARRYNAGGPNENSPFFEALSGKTQTQTNMRMLTIRLGTDGTGWVWTIPLHNNTVSCGIVVRQDIFFAKKKASNLDGPSFYTEFLKQAPRIHEMLSKAEIISEIKQATDWSYSATAYAGPHFRMAGDAGCFVDPYFSSGVHLALSTGLSAATSIQAARRGQCDERVAAKWHGTKVAEGYTRFLLMVTAVLRQLRMRESQILSTDQENGFDTAFKTIQPVIQGIADTQTEDSKVRKHAADSINFALDSFDEEKQRAAVVKKIQQSQAEPEALEKLTPEEVLILNKIVNRTYHRERDAKNLAKLSSDVIDGLSANVERGNLGLIKANLNQSTDMTEKALMASNGRVAYVPMVN